MLKRPAAKQSFRPSLDEGVTNVRQRLVPRHDEMIQAVADRPCSRRAAPGKLSVSQTVEQSLRILSDRGELPIVFVQLSHEVVGGADIHFPESPAARHGKSAVILIDARH
jgi:hypothetical protein